MKAALVQLNVTDDPSRNLAGTVQIVRDAADQGAEFVLTPEVTNCVSTSREHQRGSEHARPSANPNLIARPARDDTPRGPPPPSGDVAAASRWSTRPAPPPHLGSEGGREP